MKYKDEIVTFTSDLEQKHKNFDSLLQNNTLAQEALYLGEGADNFCSLSSVRKHAYASSAKKSYDFLVHSDLTDKTEHIAIISLGCGDSHREEGLLDILKENGYDFDYIAVDASMEMIQASKAKLTDKQYNKIYVHADFSSNAFFSAFNGIISKYDHRIFAFLGDTIGCLNQDYIIDTIKDMMSKDDILLVECQIKKEKSEAEYYQRYKSYLKNDAILNFFLYPMRQLGIDTNHGKVCLRIANEETIGALKADFYFKVSEDISIDINYASRSKTLVPSQEINIIPVRLYDPDKFINFFKSHHFDFIDSDISDTQGQFLFRKQ